MKELLKHISEAGGIFYFPLEDGTELRIAGCDDKDNTVCVAHEELSFEQADRQIRDKLSKEQLKVLDKLLELHNSDTEYEVFKNKKYACYVAVYNRRFFSYELLVADKHRDTIEHIVRAADDTVNTILEYISD